MAGFTYGITEQPLALIAVGLFIAQVLARELGGWIRRRLDGAAGPGDGESSDNVFILSTVLGLLALLIAFTFGLAVNRYEARRNLVVAEANAISTAEMRVRMLEAPQGAQLSRMLQQYAQTRLAFGQAGALDKPALARDADTQRAALQTTVLAALEPVRTTALAPFVGGAMNAVLDIGIERETMLSARVPLSVLVALALYILLSAGGIGYALTTAKGGRRPVTAILFALLTLAITLILDLDRPQGGLIRIDQSPMARLVAGFAPPPE